MLLAADVLYDEQSTDALIDLLDIYFSRRSPQGVCYLSLERRYYINMWSDEMEVHEVDRFLHAIRSKDITVERIDLMDVPIRFKYGRTRHHELLKLSKT